MVHHRGTNDKTVGEMTHSLNMIVGSNGGQQAELNQGYITNKASYTAQKNINQSKGNGSMMSNNNAKHGSKTIQTLG